MKSRSGNIFAPSLIAACLLLTVLSLFLHAPSHHHSSSLYNLSTPVLRDKGEATYRNRDEEAFFPVADPSTSPHPIGGPPGNAPLNLQPHRPLEEPIGSAFTMANVHAPNSAAPVVSPGADVPGRGSSSNQAAPQGASRGGGPGATSYSSFAPEMPHKYLLFSRYGRFNNQLICYLHALALAKASNRTLVVPDFFHKPPPKDNLAPPPLLFSSPALAKAAARGKRFGTDSQYVSLENLFDPKPCEEAGFSVISERVFLSRLFPVIKKRQSALPVPLPYSIEAGCVGVEAGTLTPIHNHEAARWFSAKEADGTLSAADIDLLKPLANPWGEEGRGERGGGGGAAGGGDSEGGEEGTTNTSITMVAAVEGDGRREGGGGVEGGVGGESPMPPSGARVRHAEASAAKFFAKKLQPSPPPVPQGPPRASPTFRCASFISMDLSRKESPPFGNLLRGYKAPAMDPLRWAPPKAKGGVPNSSSNSFAGGGVSVHAVSGGTAARVASSLADASPEEVAAHLEDDLVGGDDDFVGGLDVIEASGGADDHAGSARGVTASDVGNEGGGVDPHGSSTDDSRPPSRSGARVASPEEVFRVGTTAEGVATNYVHPPSPWVNQRSLVAYAAAIRAMSDEQIVVIDQPFFLRATAAEAHAASIPTCASVCLTPTQPVREEVDALVERMSEGYLGLHRRGMEGECVTRAMRMSGRLGMRPTDALRALTQCSPTLESIGGLLVEMEKLYGDVLRSSVRDGAHYVPKPEGWEAKRKNAAVAWLAKRPMGRPPKPQMKDPGYPLLTPAVLQQPYYVASSPPPIIDRLAAEESSRRAAYWSFGRLYAYQMMADRTLASSLYDATQKVARAVSSIPPGQAAKFPPESAMPPINAAPTPAAPLIRLPPLGGTWPAVARRLPTLPPWHAGHAASLFKALNPTVRSDRYPPKMEVWETTRAAPHVIAAIPVHKPIERLTFAFTASVASLLLRSVSLFWRDPVPAISGAMAPGSFVLQPSLPSGPLNFERPPVPTGSSPQWFEHLNEEPASAEWGKPPDNVTHSDLLAGRLYVAWDGDNFGAGTVKTLLRHAVSDTFRNKYHPLTVEGVVVDMWMLARSNVFAGPMVSTVSRNACLLRAELGTAGLRTDPWNFSASSASVRRTADAKGTYRRLCEGFPFEAEALFLPDPNTGTCAVLQSV